MKKLFLILLFAFFYTNIADSCKYTSEINSCKSAVSKMSNSKSSTIISWSSLKDFDDFVCLQDNYENIVIQIAIDLNFRKIDDEMDLYLDHLSRDKNLYFWVDSQYTYFDAVNNIERESKKFRNKYIQACSLSLSEAASCIEWNSISILNAKEFIQWSKWDCYNLVNKKISIFDNVSYNILLLNQQQVARDQKKLYDQELRTKYSKIIDIMMINLWYIERLWMKWPSKTKNTY
jgi:hypothetical protein